MEFLATSNAAASIEFIPLELIISAFSTFPFVKIHNLTVGFPSKPFFKALLGYLGDTQFKQATFNLPCPLTLPFSKSFL